jgi:hypothetical protein
MNRCGRVAKWRSRGTPETNFSVATSATLKGARRRSNASSIKIGPIEPSFSLLPCPPKVGTCGSCGGL